MISRRLLIALTVAALAAACEHNAGGQEASPYAQPGVVAQTPIAPTAPAAVQTAPVVTTAAPQTAPNQGVAPAASAPANPAAPTGPPAGVDPQGWSAVEQQFVMQTLKMWEGETAKIDNFNAEFERWEYSTTWGMGFDKPYLKGIGKLSYSKPDKGSFKIEDISRWVKTNPQDTLSDAPGEWQPQPDEIGEHWVCDGKAVYEYNHRDKQLVIQTIPEEMRGQRIVDGPLPFLFGAQAEKLLQRYWIRTVASDPASIRLEAFPRWQVDAAEYSSVDIMLDRKTMQPKALQVKRPSGADREVYIFTSVRVNDKNLGEWFTGLFSAPRVRPGWTRKFVEAEPTPQAANPTGAVQR